MTNPRAFQTKTRDECVPCFVLGFALYFIALFIGSPYTSSYGDDGFVVAVSLITAGSIVVAQTALMAFLNSAYGFRNGVSSLLLVFVPSFASTVSSGFLVSQWGSGDLHFTRPATGVLFTSVLVLGSLASLLYAALAVSLLATVLSEERSSRKEQQDGWGW